MTDNNNKTTLKEAFDAELMKRLEENPPEIPTYEEFSAMVDKSLAERCRRRKRIAGIAAGFVVVLLAGILACTNLTTDVDADKNPKEEIITEDGVIIEGGGWGSSDGEDNVWVIEEWEHVYDARKVYDDFLIPEYIPEGYEFKCLTIESLETGTYSFEYLYAKEENSLEIEGHVSSENLNTYNAGSFSRTIKTEKGDLYFKDDEKKAIIQLVDGQIVSIWGGISNMEMLEIVMNLT